MAYHSSERQERIKKIMKTIDVQIMMCDDVQDLFALSSSMLVTAKNIFKQQLGKDGTIQVFEKLLEDLYDE